MAAVDPRTPPLPAPDAGPDALACAQQRLEVLCDLGNSICAQRDSAGLFAAVPRAIRELIGAERFFLALVNEAGRLSARLSFGIELPKRTEDWPVSHSVLRRVLDEGVSLLCDDAQHDEALGGQASVLLHGIRSVLCVPIGLGPACVGLIYADHRAVTHQFSETDLQFLTALSHYVALGLQNIQRLQRSTGAPPAASANLEQELYRDHQIIGSAPALLKAYEKLRRAAGKNVPVLLLGESGTGKELFARAVHTLSPRRDKPFVAVNLAEINENLFESELFGYEKGAFTGAERRKEGRLALAAGGTLFLDEIAEIPLHLQAKLLRVIETRGFERVGGRDRVEADFRLVCATHRDLSKRVKEGAFREDLYYRLVSVTIDLPPLRERAEDIPILSDYLLRCLKSSKRITPQAMRRLQSYEWPGNVRQLVRVIEAVDALCEANDITAQDLPPPISSGRAEGESGSGFDLLRDVVSRAEKEHIRRALAITGGKKTRACVLLGMTKDTFFRRLKEYDL